MPDPLVVEIQGRMIGRAEDVGLGVAYGRCSEWIPGKGGSQVALAEDQDAVGEFGLRQCSPEASGPHKD